MSALVNLTGRWTGHYEQRGNELPVSADLVHEGADLTGAMRDGQPDRDCSLFDAAVEAGLRPGADEQIDANLRAMIPDAPHTPIRSFTHLPTDSQLVGRCDGRVVSFVKSYIGTSFHGFKVGNRMVGTESEGHSVHYQGKLSSDGLQIEGRWWIDANPERGSARGEGHFLLRREAKTLHAPVNPQETRASQDRERAWWKFW